ncbi:MAG TPA: hypothetical protein PKK26_01195 [Candidatus Wallbacteria bacterium]|nr:hypothetical protein [Candidatus Wallbacteria bacterium]
MKKTNASILTALAVAAVLLIFMASAQAASTSENFIIFKDTPSPNGRYCFAWGYASAKVDYDKLKKGDEAYFNSIPETSTIENYIVDTAACKIVCKLENSDFYAVGEMCKSNVAQAYVWSEDSSVLIYCLSSRWQTDVLDIYKAAADGTFEKYELMSAIEREVRAHLQKKHAAGYKENGESIVISYSDMRIARDGKLGMTVSVEVPKQETFGFTLKFAAQADLSKKPDVKLLSVDIKEEK